MPKDSKGSTGSSYILDEKNRKVLIPIDVNKIGDIAAQRAIIYNPNLTYEENKFLNDYMNKEIPGKVTSKYGDVRTYRYVDIVDNNKNASVSKKIVINKSGTN